MLMVPHVTNMGKESSKSILVALLLVLWSVATQMCTATKISGDFKLSGRQTEVVLGSYAALPEGAHVQLDMVADGRYKRSESLHLRAYRDTEWTDVKKLTLCSEKIKYALYEIPIVFEKKESSITYETTYEAQVMIDIHNKDPLTDEELGRNHYWYFLIDDCSLEIYGHDAEIPKIHYTIHMRNFRVWKTHYIKYGEFSSDEQNVFPIHSFSMFTNIIVIGLLFLHILYKFNFDRSKQYTVHAAVLWVTGAAILDFISGVCEMLHIAQFNQDGVGIYTLDALAAHFEAQCDSMIMILLLSIAAGWTLPSSVITVPASSTSSNQNTNPIMATIHNLISSLARPISTGLNGSSGILTIAVATVHIILAQWGRIYNDNFDSYHDMDHLPGQLLLFIRVVVGLLFIATVRYTASSPKCPPALSKFYHVYGYIGVAWFWALPIWVAYCHIAVPHYQLKPYVFGGCSVVQGLSHVMLGLFVTTQVTSYHQYSHIASKNQRETLTDNLDVSNNSSTEATSPTKASTTWSIGRKAKVRLD